jgi:hypothetical protein
LSIANQSWACSKRGVSCWFWDIGQVPLRNFDWLPFTPLWSPLRSFNIDSSVVHVINPSLKLDKSRHMRIIYSVTSNYDELGEIKEEREKMGC